uniref:ATP synthase F0 subunit 6 n=1 Tax=Gunungiella acanthoclada TaxID=3025504 RepID=UPI002435485C|nr:ATP synthase F0 subunit 6 [Gunungiella acanthoclada]WEU80054.1 ATP synthase F0 subunit 6 [Gunungiella acanthoclada]
MMMNLFSIFDPSCMFNIPLNWLSSILLILFMPMIFWICPTKINFSINTILIYIHKEFKLLLGKSSFKGSTMMFISLFTLVLYNNFFGLFPYIFTSTSHLSMNLTFSLPLWITFMVFGWMKNCQHMFTHLIPQSTPFILTPFMVLIETISNLIRPMTLAVRLTANMIAGHLLVTLLSQSISSFNLIMIMVILSQIILLILEFSVAFIQAYVISILSILYSKETY